MSPEIFLTLFSTLFVNQQQVARIGIKMPAIRHEILVHSDVVFHKIPIPTAALVQINETYYRPVYPAIVFNASQPITQYLAPWFEFIQTLTIGSELWENDVVEIGMTLFSDELVQPLIHFKVKSLQKEMKQSNFSDQLKECSDALDYIVLALYNETEDSPANSTCVTHVIWSRLFYVTYVCTLIFIIW